MIDIDKFCAKEEGRYALTKPWVKAGWQYATDRSVCIRIPSTEKDTVPNEGQKLPPAAKLFEHHDDMQVKAWPKGHAEIFTTEPCYCGAVCEACQAELPNGKMHIVTESLNDLGQECDGVPVDCDLCDGSGYFKKWLPVQFSEGLWISSNYAVLIATLPKVFYAMSPKNELQVNFRFDGGEGAVMRRKAPDAEELETIKEVCA